MSTPIKHIKKLSEKLQKTHQVAGHTDSQQDSSAYQSVYGGTPGKNHGPNSSHDRKGGHYCSGSESVQQKSNWDLKKGEGVKKEAVNSPNSSTN